MHFYFILYSRKGESHQKCLCLEYILEIIRMTGVCGTIVCIFIFSLVFLDIGLNRVGYIVAQTAPKSLHYSHAISQSPCISPN